MGHHRRPGGDLNPDLHGRLRSRHPRRGGARQARALPADVPTGDVVTQIRGARDLPKVTTQASEDLIETALTFHTVPGSTLRIAGLWAPRVGRPQPWCSGSSRICMDRDRPAEYVASRLRRTRCLPRPFGVWEALCAES